MFFYNNLVSALLLLSKPEICKISTFLESKNAGLGLGGGSGNGCKGAGDRPQPQKLPPPSRALVRVARSPAPLTSAHTG